MNAKDINTESWYATNEELDWLGAWAKENPSAIVVMIGAGPGVMACALLEVSNKIGFVVIDIQTTEYLEKNLARLGIMANVKYILDASANVIWAGKPIDLLIIDGDHGYEAVKADMKAWLPHVAHDGYVLFHDYGENLHQQSTGVKQAVEECLPADFEDV